MKNLEEEIYEIVEPIAASFGCDVIDVEYKKESGDYYLRVFIEKEGGVFINDCEEVSRKLSKILDEKDPIEEAYFLEVCSPGLTRELKKAREFEYFMGRSVDIKLYKPIELENGIKQKKFLGELVSFENDIITINENGKNVKFDKKDVAKVNLHYDFD